MPASQNVWLTPHVVWQLPPEQTRFLPQTWPHVPQFALSLCVVAQYGAPPSAPQSVWPPPHAAVQTPFTQFCCAPHATPQPLQF